MTQGPINTAKGGIPLLLIYKIIFGEAVVGVLTNNQHNPHWRWGHQASGIWLKKKSSS